MPNLDTTGTSNLIETSETTALWLAGPEDMPPSVCPDLLPDGWSLADEEPIDFTFTDGGWTEVYVLRRIT